MDENNAPQDFFQEIFRSSQEPPPPRERPQFDDPPEDGPPPAPPSGGRGEKAAGSAKLLPWLLCLVLGAALLVIGVCMLRVSELSGHLELLDEVRRLEQENESLKTQKNVLSDHLEQVKEEREAFRLRNDRAYDELSSVLFTMRLRSTAENALNHLERFVNAEDWLMAATLVENYDPLFNEHSEFFTFGSALPSQTARYLELRQEVFDRGRCMNVEWREGAQDGREYTERPFVQEDAFDKQDRNAANALRIVLSNYPILPEDSASTFAFYFQPGSEVLEGLRGGAFQPSTAELLEQIRADLIAAGALVEENGVLTVPGSGATDVVVYGQLE